MSATGATTGAGERLRVLVPHVSAGTGAGAAFTRVTVLVPVFDDWDSFSVLLDALDDVAARLPGKRLSVVAVDDGSPRGGFDALAGARRAHLTGVEVLELACNLGHQRAIAVGLVELASRGGFDVVVVMDGDGEDDPEYLTELLAAHANDPAAVVTANRAERSEGPVFRAGYAAYKALFRLLTGQRIAFGNFGLLPRRAVEALVHRPELWNNLPAAIIRSRVPCHSIWTRRATRYRGTSKMNLVSLIVHGLSAISTYGDVLFARLLVVSLALGGLSALGIVTVLGIRLWTDLAIPGWTSYMITALVVLLVQAVSVSASSAFIVLHSRMSPGVVPTVLAPQYVRARHTIVPR